MTRPNRLYHGDNLDVLRGHIEDASVDLVYLDPPFNSNQRYAAFADAWRWDSAAEAAYREIVEAGGSLAQVAIAFRALLGESDTMAYLAMMAPRLVELRRVLTPTGSIYLHCDPSASHALKMLMDAIFGPKACRNEIIWKRSPAHSDTRQGMRRLGRVHDVILFYTKGDDWTWNPQHTPYDADYVNEFYTHVDPRTGERYASDNLTAARAGGDTRYEWRVKRHEGSTKWVADLDEEFRHAKPGWIYAGHRPPEGRIWAYSKANMIAFEQQGRLAYSARTGRPRYKRWLKEMPGVPLQDLWTDIAPLSSKAKERRGYPTQKPEALLERIIRASSHAGDTILDPFCGCGTTLTVAESLDRRWIGIDSNGAAIAATQQRLGERLGQRLEPRVGAPSPPSGDVADVGRVVADRAFVLIAAD
jgi:DNA modification methylase